MLVGKRVTITLLNALGKNRNCVEKGREVSVVLERTVLHAMRAAKIQDSFGKV